MKNLILLILMFILFFIDIIKVKYYPEESLIKQREQALQEAAFKLEDEKNKEKKLEELSEEDLKLDDEEIEENEENLDDDTDSSNTNNIENEISDTTENQEQEQKQTNKQKNKKKNKKIYDENYNNKINKNNNKMTEFENEEIKKLVIKHCSQYQVYSDTLKKDFMGNYTNIEYEATEYPVTSGKQLLGRICYFLQFLMGILIMTLKNYKNYLTFIPDSVFEFIESKKIMIGMFGYFIFNLISNRLTQTGAFEVSMVDSNGIDQLIFSKLKNEHLPSLIDISGLLLNQFAIKLDS